MKPLILAIDDDPLVLDLIRLHLDAFEVRTAVGGREGLEMVKQVRASLVLLDLEMPDVHGIGVLSAIRSYSRQLPVMMLTATASGEAVRRAIEGGANGYMLKPFTREQLIKRVRQTLNKQPIAWVA